MKSNKDIWYKSDRIVVRRLLLNDISLNYVTWFKDQTVTRFIKFAKDPPTLIDLQTYWRTKNIDNNVDFLGIFWTSSGQHIGNIKFELSADHSKIHVGFLIGEIQFRHQGVIRECLPSCVRILKKRRQVKRIYLTVNPENKSAQRAFLGLDFKFTGYSDNIGDLEMDYLNV